MKIEWNPHACGWVGDRFGPLAELRAEAKARKRSEPSPEENAAAALLQQAQERERARRLINPWRERR